MAPSWVTPQQLQRKNKWIEVTGGRHSTLAEPMLSAYSPGNGTVGNLFDNSLVIKDPITPANDYSGPLINPATGLFNKLTFSRPDATTCATYKDASGIIRLAAADVPRISYKSYGRVLLMEGARTQQFMNSVFAGGGFAPTAWAPGPSTGTSTPVTSLKYPAGSAYLQTASGSERPFWSQVVTTTIGSVYAVSVEVESVSSGVSCSNITNNNGGGTSQYYMNGVPVSASSDAQVGSLVFVYTAAASTTTIRLGLGTGGPSPGSLQFSCPQHELGSWPSSHIPNASTVATVTRAAETCSLANTLFNLTQSAGTLYVSNEWDLTGPNGYPIGVSDGTLSERHGIYQSTNVYAETVDGGALLANIDSLKTSSSGVLIKSAYAFTAGDTAVSAGGLSVRTSAAATMPTTTKLEIGCLAGGNQHNGGISEFAFFGSRISNANLQALTA